MLLIPSLIIVFVGLPSAYALMYSHTTWGIGGLVMMVLGILVMFSWRRQTWADASELLREGANYLKGAQGELKVHQELRQLPNEYVVFHDFHPVDPTTGKPSRWNVDHIVVGPTGVFVLDAKYYGQKRVQSAERNQYSARNVRQVQRNAIELQQRLARWSAGQLKSLFVVAAVVYVQPDALMERLREGATRTLPLRLLRGEITTHTESAIDQERAGRIARVLFSQMSADLQAKFKSEFDAYGELSKSSRYAARDARLAAQAEVTAPDSPDVSIPTVCPECGGKLVRRVAGQGSRAGKPFLGCENFRTTGCKYVFDLEE